MSKEKELALQLLLQKQTDISLTYETIERLTGYSKRQLIRLSGDLKEKDMESILKHGNTGKKPITTASDQEVSYLRNFKKPYPNITIAQFRDIYLEDVIESPKGKSDVEKYHLKPRSKSWFRELFIREGWQTPASRSLLTSGDRTVHSIRQPRPHRGDLVQIDGTPFDWFNNGETYCLHLAVDDATTEILAGWFMPTECTRGYCHIMDQVLKSYGIPLALYSDKDSVFRNVKSGTDTQFSLMMKDLRIQMIFALSPQAKGRVERANNTIHERLPNDIIRFGIPHDYDQLNQWFNRFYRNYLNKKFAFNALDPHDSYIPLRADFNYEKIFRLRLQRQMRRNMFSLANDLYSAFDEDGVLQVYSEGSKVTVYVDAFTEEIYVEHGNRHCTCLKVGERKHAEAEPVENQKHLNELLDKNLHKAGKNAL